MAFKERTILPTTTIVQKQNCFSLHNYIGTSKSVPAADRRVKQTKKNKRTDDVNIMYTYTYVIITPTT